jgi:hypothetical protein
MKRIFSVLLIVAASTTAAYAVAPDFVEACCECCKGLLDCCCD